MSFFKFKPEDIITSPIDTHPSYEVQLNGDQVTGSVYLEKRFLENSLETRQWEGFSAKQGGIVQKTGPFTASIDLLTAVKDAGNEEIYATLSGNLYPYYNIDDTDYQIEYDGTAATTLRVAAIPAIYYDRQILTGSFTGSDKDAAGDDRTVYDNGRGGLYSGSLSGTIVGNIFYNEGIVVFKKTDLTDFGSVSSTNFKWKFNFKGTHRIPTKIFRCRAPAGEVNASSNPTFYQVPSGSSDALKHERQIVLSSSEAAHTYITKVGLYNEEYELVGVANIAQPIKKVEENDLLIRIRFDF